MKGNHIPFEKIQGLGNDFIVVRRSDLPAGSPGEHALRWCQRGTSVGADGLIILSDETDRTFRMQIHNRDGSRPEICGNGIRCSVRSWAAKMGVVEASVTVETDAGPRRCELFNGGEVEVDMGAAQIEPTPLLLDGPNGRVEGSCVTIGNPHLVLFGDWPTVDPTWAAALENHEHFPNQTNVSFVEVVGEQSLKLTVWERGVGFTHACGSAACATGAVAVKRMGMRLNEPISVGLPGGVLTIRVEENPPRVVMKGPAKWVCRGVLCDV